VSHSRAFHRHLWILSAVTLIVFAAFAASVRLVAYHDDVYNIPIINTQTVLSVFDIRPYGHRDYRPIIAALWLLARDWFGWFVPAVLHWWNLAVHVVTAALVMALGLRLSRNLPLDRTALAAFAALLFASFPFAYQAVLWAGAIGHPLMTMFGLFGAFAALAASQRRSVGLAALGLLCLLCACWSHEQGFVFGALIPLVLVGDRYIQQRRLTRRDLALCAIFLAAGAAYALFYQLAIATAWVSLDYLDLRASGPGDWLKSMAFNMQAFVLGAVVLLRYRLLDVFDASLIPALLYALFAVFTVPALMVMHRLRVARLGLVALAFWLIALIPSALYLSPGYIEGSPRILYPTAVGVALFWATLIGALLEHWRSPILKLATMAAPVAFIVWSGVYIADRTADLDAFSRGVRVVADALKDARPGERVVLINFPAASGPKDPGSAFLQGNEGVMFHTDYNGTPFKHVSAINGVTLPAAHVRHDASLAQNPRYFYFAAGEPVDDGQLRDLIRDANYVFAFDYGGDRMRARELAALRPDGDSPDAPVLGKLTHGGAQVLVRDAHASVCDGRLQVQIAWADARDIAQPAGVFVHGFDAQGNQVLGADADLVNGLLPLEQMPPGIALTEMREIALGETPAPSEVRLGVYTREGVQRWAASQADGAAWEGDAVSVPVGRCG